MKEMLGPSDYVRCFVPSIPPEENGVAIQGICNPEERVINISKEETCCRKSLEEVIIHEEVHASYPEFNERETEVWTKELIKKLKPKQKQLYFNLYDGRTTRHYKP